MTYHIWGDKNVDWKGINEAANYIAHGLIKYGLISVYDYKEKYGTVRVSLSFGWDSLHSITHPGYHYIQYNKFFSKIFIYNKVVRKFFKLLNPIVIPYQKFIYKLMYKKAILKWPHLTNEILYMADYDELLRPVFANYFNFVAKLDFE